MRKLILAWGWTEDPHQVEAIAAAFGALCMLIGAIGVSSRETAGWAFTTAAAVSTIGAAVRGSGGGKDNFKGPTLFSPLREGSMPVRTRFDPVDAAATNESVSHQMWLTGAAALSLTGVCAAQEVQQYIRDGATCHRDVHLPFARLVSLAGLLTSMCGYGFPLGRSLAAILDVGVWVYGLKALVRALAHDDQLRVLAGGDSDERTALIDELAAVLHSAHAVNGTVDLIRAFGNLVYSVGAGKVIYGIGSNITARMSDSQGGEAVVVMPAPSPVRDALFQPTNEATRKAGACTPPTEAESRLRLDHPLPAPGSVAVGCPPFTTHPPAPDVGHAGAAAGSGAAEYPAVPEGVKPPPRGGRSTAAVKARRAAEAVGESGFSLKASYFTSALYLWWPAVVAGLFVGLSHAFVEALQRYVPGLWYHVRKAPSKAVQHVGDVNSTVYRASPGADGLAVMLGGVSHALAEFEESTDAAVQAAGDPPASRSEIRVVEEVRPGYGGVPDPDFQRFVATQVSMFDGARCVYLYGPLRQWTFHVAASLAIGVLTCLNVLRTSHMLAAEQAAVLGFYKDCCAYMSHGEDGQLPWHLRSLATVHGRPVLPPMPPRIKVALGLLAAPAAGGQPAGGTAAVSRAAYLRQRLLDLQRMAGAAAEEEANHDGYDFAGLAAAAESAGNAAALAGSGIAAAAAAGVRVEPLPGADARGVGTIGLPISELEEALRQEVGGGGAAAGGTSLERNVDERGAGARCLSLAELEASLHELYGGGAAAAGGGLESEADGRGEGARELGLNDLEEAVLHGAVGDSMCT